MSVTLEKGRFGTLVVAIMEVGNEEYSLDTCVGNRVTSRSTDVVVRRMPPPPPPSDNHHHHYYYYYYYYYYRY